MIIVEEEVRLSVPFSLSLDKGDAWGRDRKQWALQYGKDGAIRIGRRERTRPWAVVWPVWSACRNWPRALESVSRDEIPREQHAYIIPPLRHVIVRARTEVPCMLGTPADARLSRFGRSRTILASFHMEFVRFDARAGGGTKVTKG
jgi:hypothetical protein